MLVRSRGAAGGFCVWTEQSNSYYCFQALCQDKLTGASSSFTFTTQTHRIKYAYVVSSTSNSESAFSLNHNVTMVDGSAVHQGLMMALTLGPTVVVVYEIKGNMFL